MDAEVRSMSLLTVQTIFLVSIPVVLLRHCRFICVLIFPLICYP
jgi:hypothetical protein